jgi:hypothetical protein
LRALSACLLLTAFGGSEAGAQTLTSELLRPVRGGFVAPQDLPLRRIDDASADSARSDQRSVDNDPAPSRIFRPPSYGLPAASGASDIGYDSLNRRRKGPKYFPGAPKPRRAGPGSPAVEPRPPQSGPPSANANKSRIAPSLAGTVVGQPQRKRLRPDDDPFGAVGDYAGGFLVKSAVEFRGGYDTNPGRLAQPKGSAFYVVAPEFLAVSNWERHAVVADLRGSYTGYGSTLPAEEGQVNSAPTMLDRPEFNGHIDGRLDASRDTRLTSQLRLRVGTDNPGSPSIQAGLSKYPLYAAVGGTFGVDQTFNRLQLSTGGTVDRTAYQASQLTGGSTDGNNDRNFNQYGGVGRASYEVLPWLKPFAEVQGDTRVHDLQADRGGYRRDSNGGYAKAGTSFELTRLLTGEASIGYATRTYTDPRLEKLTGLLTSASLIWSMTTLTTVKFIANTSVDESTSPGVSGVLTRTYTAEVDHDFRHWLSGVGRFSWGTQDYQGSSRFDRVSSISGDLVYKLNRWFQLKSQVRHDWLDSSEVGASTAATVVMLGVRLQN